MENNKKEVSKPEETGNVPAAFTYFGLWITGLIFLLIEKEDKFVRFNAAQSLVTFGALNILMFFPPLIIFVMPLCFVLWVVLMYKAYKEEKVELPIVSDFAKKVEKSFK